VTFRRENRNTRRYYAITAAKIRKTRKSIPVVSKVTMKDESRIFYILRFNMKLKNGTYSKNIW